MDIKRLYVDMDGTTAVFKNVDTIETLYILSAVLSDSKFALEEKNYWLDKYLPEIDYEHRIFTRCGEDKKAFIPGGVKETDYLLDDYTTNLNLWEPPAKGIKILNGINHTNKSWKSVCISNSKGSHEIAENIISIMKEGKQIMDEHNHNNPNNYTEFMQESKPKIKFFVAECMEFTTLGAYYENIETVEKAFEIYSSITSENMGKGIGIKVYAPDNELYNGTEVSIYSAGEIDDVSLYGDFFTKIEEIKKATDYLDMVLNKHSATVNYIIEEGTLNTTEGNWVIYTDEIQDKFNLEKEDYLRVVELLSQREEVSQVTFNSESIDVDFYLDYCNNFNFRNEKENVSSIIKKAGFKPTNNVVNNIIKLNHMLGKEHSLKEIKSLKQTYTNDKSEQNKLVNEICNEFKEQEYSFIKVKITGPEII